MRTEVLRSEMAQRDCHENAFRDIRRECIAAAKKNETTARKHRYKIQKLRTEMGNGKEHPKYIIPRGMLTMRQPRAQEQEASNRARRKQFSFVN